MRRNQYSKTGTLPSHGKTGYGEHRGTQLCLSQLPQECRGESNTNSGFAEWWDSDRTLFFVQGGRGFSLEQPSGLLGEPTVNTEVCSEPKAPSEQWMGTGGWAIICLVSEDAPVFKEKCLW